jgi:hypothetical protein
MIVPEADLVTLTGYIRASAQIRWLRRNARGRKPFGCDACPVNVISTCLSLPKRRRTLM